MKGTAARGADAASDALARASLRENPKDRAENLMIVDLLRNDLGRIAELGSVSVKELFAVETYPTVHQMTSTIVAKRAAGASVSAIVRALFPCGSVTGALRRSARWRLSASSRRARAVSLAAPSAISRRTGPRDSTSPSARSRSRGGRANSWHRRRHRLRPTSHCGDPKMPNAAQGALLHESTQSHRTDRDAALDAG